MPLPPPLRDSVHIETRLLVVAEMLEKAVAEVHRAMAEIKSSHPPAGDLPTTPIERPVPTDDARSTDV